MELYCGSYLRKPEDDKVHEQTTSIDDCGINYDYTFPSAEMTNTKDPFMFRIYFIFVYKYYY